MIIGLLNLISPTKTANLIVHRAVKWCGMISRSVTFPMIGKFNQLYQTAFLPLIKPGVEMFDTKTYLATADVKGTSISIGTNLVK